MNAGLFGLPSRKLARRISSLVLLEEQTARNSPTLDFRSWYSPLYDEFQIHLVDVLPVATGNINIAMRCSTDGGANFDTGNNYSWVWFVQVVAGGGTGGANATNFIGLIPMGSSNANWGACGVFDFHNPAAGARYKQLHGTGAGHDLNRGATDVEVVLQAGVYLSVTPVNALRFQVSAGASGNIDSGTIRIYGKSKLR